jgi:hypothetical protein
VLAIEFASASVSASVSASSSRPRSRGGPVRYLVGKLCRRVGTNKVQIRYKHLYLEWDLVGLAIDIRCC